MFEFAELKDFLEQKYAQYNTPEFIANDPIQIPHQFTEKKDIEIAGFLAATIAWGNRKMIIRNANRIMEIMQHQPYKFLAEVDDQEIDQITNFVHRTFNLEDLKFFLKSLKNIYLNHGGLEQVFCRGFKTTDSVKGAIAYMRRVFLSLPHSPHVEKHISCVTKGSAAKRINMFLMWMVRNDHHGVHFGIWDCIPTSALMIPLDVHTGNSARALGLLQRKQNDWKAVEELTENLKKFDPNDPVKYDFALFGLDLELKLHRLKP